MGQCAVLFKCNCGSWILKDRYCNADFTEIKLVNCRHPEYPVLGFLVERCLVYENNFVHNQFAVTFIMLEIIYQLRIANKILLDEYS